MFYFDGLKIKYCKVNCFVCAFYVRNSPIIRFSRPTILDRLKSKASIPAKSIPKRYELISVGWLFKFKEYLKRDIRTYLGSDKLLMGYTGKDDFTNYYLRQLTTNLFIISEQNSTTKGLFFILAWDDAKLWVDRLIGLACNFVKFLHMFLR